ncbi:MAG: tRNA (N(6)-L-threonylcarbamoyladenosine(37)-C(2))-methylthiotransferase MtaB [Lachnospiraceae bacterium]
MQKKLALHSLGCKVNSYETEKLRDELAAAGYEIVPFAPGAGIYIINTCTVTNVADRKSRQMLHKAKKMNPDAIVVATGCYVQADAKEAEIDSAVDLVVDNTDKHRLPAILEEYLRGRRGCEAGVEQEAAFPNEHDSLSHVRAFCKIQDGCNQFCSYCIIPYVRGRIKSRPKAELYDEIVELAQKGYREIVLTGIHISSYGLDRQDEPQTMLIDLLEALHCIEGIERIRLGSLEPRIITPDFAKRLARLPKLCPHFHLSLQSGCDETLRRMNRKYTMEEYEASVRLLRTYFPDLALTTDLIVGFPGETPQEFAQTYEAVEQLDFYETHVFKYSKRQGTKAAVMPDQIPGDVQQDRSERLLCLNRRQMQAYEDTYKGRVVEVLFEEEKVIDSQVYFVGHTREYCKVAVLKDERSYVNEILSVRILGHVQDGLLLGGLQ